LDRFATTITFADGTSAISDEIGDPIPIEGKIVASVAINTGRRLRRTGKN